MELESVVKIIGCLVITAIIFSIPCLTTLAWVLNWHLFFKYLFTISSTGVIITMAVSLYISVD